MQIPMEILNQMMTKADFGAGVRQKTGQGSGKGGSQFEKMLEEALAETKLPITDNSGLKTKDAKDVAEKEPLQDEPFKAGEDTDEDLAAAMMGNQGMVVFILEGDMESATTPETRLGAAADTGAADGGGTAHIGDTGQNTVEARPEPDKPFITDAQIEQAIDDAAPMKAGQQSGQAGQAGQTGNGVEARAAEPAAVAAADVAAATAAAAKAGETQNDGAADGIEDTSVMSGEVTARMPNIRTSERRENMERGSGFSENGNLSPLENENDETPVKGQKGKAYSEAASTTRDRAEVAPQPATAAPQPPGLAEGIKPEQFVADQQMKQAAAGVPVKTENLFEEMVSRLETMNTESTRAMTIQLKPEFLGNVALEVSIDAAGLHVKINAANSDVRAMINGQVNALIESLEDKGIEVVEVEVAYTGVDNGAFRDSREGQAQQNRPRRPHYSTNIIDSASYYSALPMEALDYYLDTGVSSVEYRA